MVHRMVAVMNWLYYLTTREKVLCLLSLLAIMTGIWFHITDLLEKEKQWYIAKINDFVENEQDKPTVKSGVTAQKVAPSFSSRNGGDILAIIEKSLLNHSNIELLNADISSENGVIIKLKSQLVPLSAYLDEFNQSYPGIHWNSIRFRPLNDKSLVEFSFTLAKRGVR